MRINDFFCGAGGMGLGFKNAGFDIVGAWDFDRYAVQSYAHNIGSHVKQADVSEMVGSDIPDAEIWTFGFPCQDISIAGKGAGMSKGTRSGLFYEIMRLLGEVENKPPFILAENVKNVKKCLPEIKAEYDDAGYTMIASLYNSKYWGVPQNRERFFILGIRKDIDSFTFEMPHQVNTQSVKLKEVLEDCVDEKYYLHPDKVRVILESLPDRFIVKNATKQGYVEAFEGDSINISHPNSKTRRGRRGVEVAQTLLTGNEQVVVILDDTYGYDGTRTYLESSPTLRSSRQGLKVLEAISEETGLLNPEGCGKTLRVGGKGSLSKKHNYEHLIDYDLRIRKLTPREYARLQGFPDTYKQVVSNTQFYKQMGNAVTVNVSEAIARRIAGWWNNE